MDAAAPSTGGLAVGLGEALCSSNGLWFGWNGEIVSEPGSPTRRQGNGYTTLTVPLSPREHRDYYLGYANECLWPVLHYRMDHVHANQRLERQYHAVNARFAKTLAPEVGRDDIIWVHDYHLIPLAAHLRQQAVTNRIGFFLHTPFPSPETFAALPKHDALARSLFAYDLVGFQTVACRDNFIQYALRFLGVRQLHDGRLRGFGRTLKIDAFPIGIDVEDFERQARTHARDPEIGKLVAEAGAHGLIIGVDRLDYSKGLPERIEALDLLFQTYPDLKGRLRYLQVAPATREGLPAYEEIRSELNQLIGRVNGRHGTLTWEPIRYLNTPKPREFLAGLMRNARIGLVTPLRDGMNLVAKEYIAAQDAEDPGILILSEFAGAAEQLEGALIVNPHDRQAVSEAILRAIDMPRDERIARHARQLAVIRSEDVNWWHRHFLDTLCSDGHHILRLPAARPLVPERRDT